MQVNLISRTLIKLRVHINMNFACKELSATVRHIVLSRMTHPLLGARALQRSMCHGRPLTKPLALYENVNHDRAVDLQWGVHFSQVKKLYEEGKLRIVQFYHAFPTSKRSEEKVTHQGRESKYTYIRGGHIRRFQVVLKCFLCRHVLCLPDIHAHVDTFAAYNKMIQDI